MARAADSTLRANVITNQSNKDAYKDANGDPMCNVLLRAEISDPSGVIAPGPLAIIITQAAPASSGTRYSSLHKSSLALDLVNGKIHIKTSAVGATDAWAVVGAQT